MKKYSRENPFWHIGIELTYLFGLYCLYEVFT